MRHINKSIRDDTIWQMTSIILVVILVLGALDVFFTFFFSAVFGGLMLILSCLIFVLIGWWIDRKHWDLSLRTESLSTEWRIALRTVVFLGIFWFLVTHKPLVIFGILAAGAYAFAKAVRYDRSRSRR